MTPEEEAKLFAQSWYKGRPILGYGNIYQIFILLGGREIGKSYFVTNFFLDQIVNREITFILIYLNNKKPQLKNIQARYRCLHITYHLCLLFKFTAIPKSQTSPAYE